MSKHHGRTATVISPLLDGFYYGTAHHVIHQVLSRHGVKMVAIRSDGGLSTNLGADHTDGWIVISQDFKKDEMKKLLQTGKPVIALNCSTDEQACYKLVIDQTASMKQLIDHLVEHGHTRIAFFGGTHSKTMNGRYEEYKAALQEHKLEIDDELFVSTSFNQHLNGSEAAKQLIKRNRPFTAVVCGNDSLALGAMEYFQQAGYRIPEDVVVVGFDNIILSRSSNPSLTTVHNPTKEMAEKAANLLLQIWEGEEPQEKEQIFKTQLCLRGSCGCKVEDNVTLTEQELLDQIHTQNSVIQHLEHVLNTNNESGKRLLSTSTNKLPELGMLMPKNTSKGCFALWKNADNSEEMKLQIKAFYRTEHNEEMKNALISASEFPPKPFLTHDEDKPNQVTTLIPIRSEKKEWGVLVMEGEMDMMRLHRNFDAMGHSYDLLAIALERWSFEEQMIRMAYHDSLTNLPNRANFEEKLAESLQLATHNGNELAVLLMDMDRFKFINDSYGHLAGDAVLRQTAQRISESIKPKDVVARLSGDEFIILLSEATSEEAIATSSLILEKLRSPFYFEGIEFHTSSSIGISLYPQDGQTPAELIRNADMAMYKAKNEGKDQVALYSKPLSQLAQRRWKLESALRQAIQQEELFVCYQPQVDLTTGKYYGAEALVRWNSSLYGLISPAEFIPLAEEVGLIHEIDRWVAKQSIKQWKEWILKGYSPEKLSVNVSAGHFSRIDFVSYMKQLIAEADLPPCTLCLEITESTALRKMEASISKLNELISYGIDFALDDFGTGYSSLYVLKELPFTIVKIDQLFIRDLLDKEESEGIVRAIITMAQGMNRKTISEGVESRDQLNMLKNLGNDYAQGYHLGKPMSPEELLETFVKPYSKVETGRSLLN